jgi:hypothetical protein
MTIGRIIGIREVISNLLRIMRGGGYADRLLNDIESIAEFTVATKGDFGLRSRALDDMVASLQKWIPDETEHPDVSDFEYGVCDAALRIVAARLDGNATQRSKAHSDLWRHIHAQQERQADGIRADRERQVDRLVAEAQLRHRHQASAAKANGKVMKAANDNATSYVYFITDGEAIKIGKADKPKSRLSGLQTSHHKPLRFLATMPGGAELERELHGVFAQFRIRGEWFKDCREIRDFINRHGDHGKQKTEPMKAA